MNRLREIIAGIFPPDILVLFVVIVCICVFTALTLPGCPLGPKIPTGGIHAE